MVSHTYTAIGTYIATLIVDDNGNGGRDTTTVTIDVVNLAPTAAFTASPTFGQPPLPVSFDATNSTDPNGDLLTYSWDFGDGQNSTGVTASHTYSSEGTYTVTLTVTDIHGGHRYSHQYHHRASDTCGLVAEVQNL